MNGWIPTKINKSGNQFRRLINISLSFIRFCSFKIVFANVLTIANPKDKKIG